MTEEERLLRFKANPGGCYVSLRKILGEEAWKERQRKLKKPISKEKRVEYQSRVPREKWRKYERRWREKIYADPVRHEALKAKDRARYAKNKPPSKIPARHPAYLKRAIKSRKWKSRQLEIQKWKCALCKGDLRKLGFQVDHIVPRHAGGTNEASNLWMLCPKCNREKWLNRMFLC